LSESRTCSRSRRSRWSLCTQDEFQLSFCIERVALPRKKARSVAARFTGSNTNGDPEREFNSRLESRRATHHGYPQKLWISLWMTGAEGQLQTLEIPLLSNWSIFSHVILYFTNKWLDARLGRLLLLSPSTCGSMAQSSQVCITSSVPEGGKVRA
jgi:hypothetical protein